MLKIKEGVSGYYFYHWAEENEFISLCDRAVMNASSQIWGEKNPSHFTLQAKWCTKCEELRCSEN